MPPAGSSDATLASQLIHGASRRIKAPWLRLRAFLIPSPLVHLPVRSGTNLRWMRAREQILTGLLRVAALLSIPVLLSTMGTAEPGLQLLMPLYLAVFTATWVLAMRRSLDYRLRATMFVLAIYSLGVTELLNFGYSTDAYGALVAFTLITQLLFDSRLGRAALLLSVATLAAIGGAISTHALLPGALDLRSTDLPTTATTSLFFLAAIGSVQFGIGALFRSIEEAWQQAIQARYLLEHERDRLEQRVEERTIQLAQARDQALQASRYKAEQNEFLSALHETTISLLRRQERGELLRVIIERASEFLDAPYGELLLYEDEQLVAHAGTNGQPLPANTAVRRGEARLAWQAFDTRQPAIVDDYSSWPQRHDLCTETPTQAVVCFPILMGARCLGVLAMARTTRGYTFTPEEIQKGMLFSQLAAVVLDNAQLYAIALHEIDERRQAERTLQSQAEILQAQNRELDAFAHTVAHDLKGPLTSLTGQSQLLQLSHRELSPAELEHELGKLVLAGFKMGSIIDALLLLSSVRSNTEVVGRALPMAQITAAAAARLQDAAHTARATITMPKHWPTAIGYSPWVEEVWVNYLSNAIKYGGPQPVIVLDAEHQADGCVRFWVQDSGPGLSAEQQSQLFTPFTRLHSASAPGHGLGLSIVQRIVARLGGSVGVESEPGQGSRFFFTLPAEPL